MASRYDFDQQKDPNKPTSFDLERVLAWKLGMKLVTDKKLQFEDKDLVGTDGKTYSVKLQEMAGKTGNFSFEVEEMDTRSGDTKPGNFLLCKADRCFIALPVGNKYKVLVFDHSALLKEVNSGKHTSRTLRPDRIDANRRANKKYDDARNVLIKVSSISGLALGVWEFDYLQVKQDPSYKAFLASLKP